MVQLAQAEIIQIYRKRAGLNQGNLGATAFKTSFESGRTKIKNIELGRQVPTIKDIEMIAAALKMPITDLITGSHADRGQNDQVPPPGVTIHQAVIEVFPGLDAYVDMLNNAVRVQDQELVAHICDKLAGLLTTPGAEKAVND